jgi:hypothetical protein
VLSGGIGPKRTIQAGLNEADDYGIVHVAPGVYSENITIECNVWLDGAGARDTIIDAGGAGPVVDITGSSLVVMLHGLTIRNGNGYWAGGIVSGWDCELIVWECAVINNRGVIAGGINCEDSFLELVQSLVTGNMAGEVGGGLLIYDSWAELVSSTVSGNSIGPGGHEGGGIYGEVSLIYLDNVTLAFNSATADPTNVGGGLSSWGVDWLIYNTIIAGNRASQTGTNNAFFSSPVDDAVFDEYSIDSENTCRLTDPTSQTYTNPGLGPLQNNGGQTDTYAITSDSPAFDRGGPYILLIDLDQRGVERPQYTASDIGAFELVLSQSGSVISNGGADQDIVRFSCSAGGIVDLVALPSTACSGTPQQGMILPYGMFSFRIVGITPGSTVTVTIKFARPVPSTAQYWKCIGTGSWINCTSIVKHIPGDDFIVLTLTDGGPGDTDGIANGRIIDPGGLVLSITGLQPQSHSVATSQLQQPVMLPNLSVQNASLSTREVRPGEPVIVTTTVINRGSANGIMKLSLTVNGEEEAVTGVHVNCGGITPVSFAVSRNQPGIYRVYANGVYAGQFTVSHPLDPDVILFISSILLCTAFVLGLVLIYRRQRSGY